MQPNFDLEFLAGEKESTVTDNRKSFQYLTLLNRIASTSEHESPYEIVQEGLYNAIFIVNKKNQERTRVPLSAVVAFGHTYGFNRDELSKTYSVGIENNAAPTVAEAILRTLFFAVDAPYEIPPHNAWDVLAKTIYENLNSERNPKYGVEMLVKKAVDGINGTLWSHSNFNRALNNKDMKNKVQPLMQDYLQNLEYQVRTKQVYIPEAV